MSNAPSTYSASTFDSGMVQHRVEVGSLVAVALAKPGAAPAHWSVSRVFGRRVRWTLPFTSSTLRGMHRPECRRMASVLRAVECGRLT